MLNQCQQAQAVRVGPETCDLTETDRSDDGGVTKGFTRVNIRQMHLNSGQADAGNGIPDDIAALGVTERDLAPDRDGLVPG